MAESSQGSALIHVANDRSPVKTFQLSQGTAKGLSGKYNGWKTIAVHSASSEFSQWVEIQNMGAEFDEEDLRDISSELKVLPVQDTHYLVRQLDTGEVFGYGQFAIDRKPSLEHVRRKHGWTEAVLQREESRKKKDMEATPTIEEVRRHGWLQAALQLARSRRKKDVKATPTKRRHQCSFCPSAMQPGCSAPSWLFDRERKKAVSVAAEFPDEVPSYQVLSYTWGRAASDQWEQVAGIPWMVRSSEGLPIPLILEFVIKHFKTRHVWIDIFCISQECPKAKAREIALQSEIFRGAAGGLAWLHQTPSVWPLMYGMFSWCARVRDEVISGPKEEVRPPRETFLAFEELISDPWFSSTWALQEAILRPDMAMVGMEESESGVFFPYGSLSRTSLFEGPVTIQSFRAILSVLHSQAYSTIKTGRLKFREMFGSFDKGSIRPKDAFRLEKLIQDRGLSGMIHSTPAAILSSMSVRTSVKPHDRYYGVQSVFNLKITADYTRDIESLRAEFLGSIWTEFAPALVLALNRPTSGVSGNFLADAEDTMYSWFTWSQLHDGKLSNLPPGSSQVSVRCNRDGLLSFSSRDCREGEYWRLEAQSIMEESRTAAIYFGLPPMPIAVEGIEDNENHEEKGGSFMSSTSQLLYTGTILNESGRFGMGHTLHVYMEYFWETVDAVEKESKGNFQQYRARRVGALLRERPFKHNNVDGELVVH